MKKLLVILLVFTMLFTAFACSNGSGSGTNSGNDPANSGNGQNGSDTTEAQSKLPVVDFKNADYRVSVTQSVVSEFWVEEDDSDIINHANYARTAKVEEAYKVNIVPVISTADSKVNLYAHLDEVMSAILVGTDAYDVINIMVNTAGALAINNLVYDWSTLKYTDLDASYWVKTINDKFAVDGHLYTATGYTNHTYTYGMVFNTTKGEEYDLIDKVFKKIDNKEWTIDEFIKLVGPLWKNTDGQDGRTAGDFYGFQAEAFTNLDIYQFAFDINMLKPDEEAGFVLDFKSTRTSNAIDKVIRLYWNTAGTNIVEAAGYEQVNFAAGNAMFATINLNRVMNSLRDMEDDYIILPYPMYDENQNMYRTGMMDNYSVMCVPTSVTNTDLVSLVTEALNMYAEELVYPAYYEDALKGKYSRDEENAAKYLDLLMAGRNADAGTLFQQDLSRISMMFRDIVRGKNNSLDGYYDEREASLAIALESIIAKYRGAN